MNHTIPLALLVTFQYDPDPFYPDSAHWPRKRLYVSDGIAVAALSRQDAAAAILPVRALRLRTQLEREREVILTLVCALRSLVELDDGDEPIAWKHADRFDSAREAITRAEGTTI